LLEEQEASPTREIEAATASTSAILRVNVESVMIVFVV
jgi:hypothetical protein